MVTLKHPNAQATNKQLFKLHELTGEDTRGLKMTMKEVSDKIEFFELKEIEKQAEIASLTSMDDSKEPFSEAHVTIIEGAQRSGKTNTAVGRIVDSYFKDCIRIFCETDLKLICEVKAYDRKNRIAKIKHEGKIKLIKIPISYELYSPMRIFSNVHLFGLPFVYIPSFRHCLYWLKSGILREGWLLLDEAHLGINSRAGMTSLGQEMEKQSFQYGKMQLDVIIVTHMARLIDWTMRTIPTERLSCTFNPKTREVTYTTKKKGQPGSREITYDASQYWGNYWTNEKINA